MEKKKTADNSKGPLVSRYKDNKAEQPLQKSPGKTFGSTINLEGRGVRVHTKFEIRRGKSNVRLWRKEREVFGRRGTVRSRTRREK